MSIVTIGWLCWLAFFGYWEGRALVRKRSQDTFSYHMWHWFAVYNSDWKGRLGRLVLVSAGAWLTIHMVSGGRLM